MYLRTWPYNMTTIIQPFGCDLQPQIPKHSITTRTHAHPKQLEATVTIREQKTSKRTVCNRHAHAVPPFIAGCSHFTRKNTMCRAPASTPKQTPCNIRAAITRRSATTSPSHHFPQSPLPLVTTSLSHHFPQSPLLKVTSSRSYHFPKSDNSICP